VTAEHIAFEVLVSELEEFLVNYHELSGEEYRVIDVGTRASQETDQGGDARGARKVGSASLDDRHIG